MIGRREPVNLIPVIIVSYRIALLVNGQVLLRDVPYCHTNKCHIIILLRGITSGLPAKIATIVNGQMELLLLINIWFFASNQNTSSFSSPTASLFHSFTLSLQT